MSDDNEGFFGCATPEPCVEGQPVCMMCKHHPNRCCCDACRCNKNNKLKNSNKDKKPKRVK